ncbi:MAG: hypothetical protein GY729_14370 [Desulfobacteraceae bacterium]|nr:hypothetical protein [Desulfobacteraceae bacterium]
MENKKLIQLFTQKAEAVGTIVREMGSASDAIQYTAGIANKKQMNTLACPGLSSKDRDLISDLCKSEKLTFLESPLREQASFLDISLTWANYGIAETGTLMLVSNSEEIRIATMLAQIHIAMLPISKINQDTEAIEHNLDKILKNDTPSFAAFITGASRTADIERVLAIGVHGPVELHIALLKEA